jgi:hypothetical protein
VTAVAGPASAISPAAAVSDSAVTACPSVSTPPDGRGSASDTCPPSFGPTAGMRGGVGKRWSSSEAAPSARSEEFPIVFQFHHFSRRRSRAESGQTASSEAKTKETVSICPVRTRRASPHHVVRARSQGAVSRRACDAASLRELAVLSRAGARRRRYRRAPRDRPYLISASSESSSAR